MLFRIGATEMSLMKPEENTQESLIQDFSLPVLSILTSSAIGDPTGLSASVIPIIVREVIRRVISPLTSRSESKRLYQWAKQAAEGITQRSKDGEKFRKDGFFEETPTNRSNFEEVVESTLKKVMDTTEDPKIKFMASVTENVHFDQDLDMDTYRQILKDLDELTYRQLCIIRLVILYENKEVNVRRISEADIKCMSGNERTRFYSIGREFQKLVDDHYMQSVAMFRDEETNEPLLQSPSAVYIPSYTYRLHSLANLDEIPIGDIENTFSIWNVKAKKQV